MDYLEARPAIAADLPEVHALIESAYRGETAKAGWTHEADLLDGPRTSLEALEAILGNPEELLLLFRDDSTIIGCVHLTRLSATSTYFGLLTVQPGRQSGGLGKHIIATAEREAIRRFGAKMM